MTGRRRAMGALWLAVCLEAGLLWSGAPQEPGEVARLPGLAVEEVLDRESPFMAEPYFGPQPYLLEEMLTPPMADGNGLPGIALLKCCVAGNGRNQSE